MNPNYHFRKSYIDQFSFLNHPNRNIKPPSIDDNKLAVAMGDSVNLYSRFVIRSLISCKIFLLDCFVDFV